MCIKNYIIIIAILILFNTSLDAWLLINEIACATSGDDWVELFYYSSIKESMDISGIYVTMYYGTNERLSNDPVTIYSYDRPETPWDDRFVVVHLTTPGIPDETDLTGDTNRNGCIDVYCNNYSGSLWETDCVVAIDSDDDPANNGIIDFMAYSNRDGTPNTTIVSYMTSAQGFNQWVTCPGKTNQECMVDIGKDELKPYMSIARKNGIDSNSQEDFSLTKFLTPGRENIISENISSGRNLFKPLKSRISIGPGSFAGGYKNIDIFVFEMCNIRLRIFSSIGMLIYESPLQRDVYPGNFEIQWDVRGLGKKAAAGLYIAQIEATKKEIKKSQKENIYVIVSQNKK
jgi:hypothetical protein